MDSETFRAIQVLALQAIEDPQYEDFYRSVCRWFSEKFSTSLPTVEEMADQYVLRHYYETVYGEVKDATGEHAKDNYEALKASVLQTEVEQTEAEIDDDAWAKEIADELAKQTSQAISKTMAEIDEHIKTIQSGEIMDEFASDDSDDEFDDE
jgi:hypothetical protein